MTLTDSRTGTSRSTTPQATVAVLSFPGALVETAGALENAIMDVYYESPLLTVFGTPDEVKAVIRGGTDRTSMSLIRTLSRSEDHARRIHAAVEQAYRKRALHATARPGAVALMERAKDAALSVVLTTTLSRPNRECLLDHLGWRGLVDLLLGPEDGGRTAPAPDLALTALLRAGGADVAELLVVADTPADIAAGAHAGSARVIGVATDTADAARLTAAGATAVVPTLREVPGVAGLV
ncbi:MAG: HAD family hydrolase [Mycetocola sp.]